MKLNESFARDLYHVMEPHSTRKICSSLHIAIAHRMQTQPAKILKTRHFIAKRVYNKTPRILLIEL